MDLLVTAKPKTTLIGLVGLSLDVEEVLNRKVEVVTDDAICHLLGDRILGEAVTVSCSAIGCKRSARQRTNASSSLDVQLKIASFAHL